MIYVLVDYMNLANRAKYASEATDLELKIGMSIHIILNSIRKVNTMFGADCILLCAEGKSWRKSVYPPYKKNRIVNNLKKSIEEQEDDKMFLSAFSEIEYFFKQKTNVVVLQGEIAEADDMIALFIAEHPEDTCIIVSADSDFIQLLSENVMIYNGITEELITVDGYFDESGAVKKNKDGTDKEKPEPELSLFVKCIRGDKSDNVFSAYPGVRMNGSSKKVGIMEAYEDRHEKKYNWNNFMLSSWVDENDETQQVLACYNRNKQLIDLTAQPDDVKDKCREDMMKCICKDKVNNVGIYFMQFCEKWNLPKIQQDCTYFANLFNNGYKGKIFTNMDKLKSSHETAII